MSAADQVFSSPNVPLARDAAQAMILAGCLLAMGCVASAPLAGGTPLTTRSSVTLTGRVEVRTALDADHRAEKILVLLSSWPIQVAGDDFGGPVDGVSAVQLAFMRESDPSRFKGKKVVLRGKLFYPHTAHHHTPVLMEVEEIDMIE